MLYGIRRDLQASLVAEGYPFRVYVPFGKEWFPYFMRRLGERPANVGFVVKGIFGDRVGCGSGFGTRDRRNRRRPEPSSARASSFRALVLES